MKVTSMYNTGQNRWSINAETRKVVIYTWSGQSQRKLWWKTSERCWRADRLSRLGIGAKDSSNNLVAGSFRNISQDSKNLLALFGKANG